MRKFFFLLFLSPCYFNAAGQSAILTGSVTTTEGAALAQVSVMLINEKAATATDAFGKFSLALPAGKTVTVLFSHTGFKSLAKSFYLSKNEQESTSVQLVAGENTLETVVVSTERNRTEAGLIQVNPRVAAIMPSTVGGVEGIIKTIVGSNNELTSQYNVRGGNFDENLVYINDFEVYRPYLVSSGQQEGLSLINAALTRNINFYTGAFPAKYGDKLSSVLDIEYKKPQAFGGFAYAGLLEQGLSLEGSARKGRFTYIAGVRNKSNRNLLSSQATQGAYIPSSSDVQALLTLHLSNKVSVEWLNILSASRFTFYPESVQKTAAVFSPFFTANLGLDVFFEGQEKDRYKTFLSGLTVKQSLSQKLELKWLLSRFNDSEKENFDIAGTYLFGDRDFDNSSGTFGQITNPLGAGYYQNYGRNELDISIWNLGHRGSFEGSKHHFQWGLNAEQTRIDDRLHQFEYRDSAGYSLPYVPGTLSLYSVQNNDIDLTIGKYSGFVQDNIRFKTGNADLTLQGGVRFNYNNLNNEFLISPRVQLGIKPAWRGNTIFKLAAGAYDQPPFYRELRNFNGGINTNIKAQRSYQFVAGADHAFKGPDNRQMRFTAEAYYKSLRSVVPYDVDNVKIRYLGANNARAYATGIEARLFGELVKDAESRLSVAFMRTRENLDNDFYYQYRNAAGEVINAGTIDKVATDSTRQDVGWLRRPTDRLITVGLYLEDYLRTNKNFKIHLNAVYGSNMSYNIPGAVRYRNGLVLQPYIRADVGFSVLLLSEKNVRRSKSPARNLEAVWASLEIFNLVNRANTISYQLIKDFSNTVYALPNRLTPRLVNIKISAKF